MRFGLFGSATARHGGPDVDSGQGYKRIRRIQCRGRGARLSLDLPGRASFHRLRAGLREPVAAHLGGGADQDLAARHRGAGAALAQSGAARRAGRDHRSALRRPARFRRRQGLPPQRIRRLLRADRGGRRALQRVARRHREVLDVEAALLAPGQILAVRGHHRRAADGAKAASADLDGRRQSGLDQASCGARL